MHHALKRKKLILIRDFVAVSLSFFRCTTCFPQQERRQHHVSKPASQNQKLLTDNALPTTLNVVYAKWTMLILQIDTFANALMNMPARDRLLESTRNYNTESKIHLLGTNYPS